MISRNLILTALGFQIIGLVWDFVYHVQTKTLNTFFEQAHWPFFLGFVLLIVAVLQASPQAPRQKAVDPNKDNPHLP